MYGSIRRAILIKKTPYMGKESSYKKQESAYPRKRFLRYVHFEFTLLPMN